MPGASADGIPPVPPRRSSNFFRFGRAGISLPGATTFAVQGEMPTGPNLVPDELKGLTIIMRMSLHGYYPSYIELG